MPTDPMQTFMTIVINNYLGLTIVNGGAYKIVMDTQVMEKYRLTVCKAVEGKGGRLGVLGSGIQYDYIFQDSFDLRVGYSDSFVFSGIRVIEYSFPLFLLGTDIL